MLPLNSAHPKLNESKVNDVHRLRLVGMDPEMWFVTKGATTRRPVDKPPMEKEFKSPRSPSDVGRVPERRLLERSTARRLVILPMELGMDPVREFPDSVRY